VRVVLLHQAFASGSEAGGTRHWELGSRLPQYGHHLTVVGSAVSYLTGKAAPSRDLGREDETDVEVIRVPALNVHHRGFIWRVIAFLWFAVASAVVALRLRDVDLVMGTTPPIFQAMSAWWVAALRRKPLLLEVRDLWPDFAIAMGVLRNPIAIALARKVELFLYGRATIVLVNSPAYRDAIRRKGVPLSKLRFIPNGVDVSMFDPDGTGASIRERFGLQDAFLVVYAGAHGMANDLGTILQAADHLQVCDGIHVLFVGDGKERAHLETHARALGLRNVTFAGAMPKTAMPEVLAAADVCIATLMNIPMFATTYPNKVFDYMAAGRPTILAIDGVIRQVVEEAGGGIFVPPGDSSALSDSIESLYRDRPGARAMGRAARRYVESHFDRVQQARELAAIIDELGIRNDRHVRLQQ
jgi:glycosyltransferase involved in cell wall biosynthesis